MEKMGHMVPWFTTGGVLIVEVSKQVAKPSGTGIAITPVRGVLEGIRAGAPEPALGRSVKRN